MKQSKELKAYEALIKKGVKSNVALAMAQGQKGRLKFLSKKDKGDK